MVCVFLRWYVGRLEHKTRLPAEEIARLRKEVDDRAPTAT
jgi:hypothetical protein